MGCDIHTYAERRDELDKWIAIDGVHPFDHRHYGLFGWLADVRNYSTVPPLCVPRGIPDDVSRAVAVSYEDWRGDAHTPSWVSVRELLDFDYDSSFEDRRFTKQITPNSFDGGATCDPGDGRTVTYREFFGEDFFRELEELRRSGAERIVFWFDN